MKSCKQCGSHAINPHLHGRDNTYLNLRDVCYWRVREEIAFQAGMERAAEIAAARYVGDNSREDMEARKIAAAIREEAKE